MKGIFKDSSFSSRFFQLWFIFLFCFFVGTILGVTFTSGDAENVFSFKMQILIMSVFAFLVPPFILTYFWGEKPFRFLGFRSNIDWKMLLFVALMMIIAIPFVNLLADLNKQISFPAFLSGFEERMKASEARAIAQTERLLTVHTLGGLLFNVFLIAIIPSLGEELFFRGTLQRIFSNARGAIFAVWVTAIIFSAFHFQFYGFVPRVVLGAFLGYLFVWSGNIWLSIVAHFANNAFIVIYFYFFKKSERLIALETVGAGETWWIGVLCGLVFVGGIWFLRKKLSEPRLSRF